MSEAPLSITEQFLFLSHHPRLSRYYTSGYILQGGIVGALIMELEREGSLEEKRGRIHALKPQTALSTAHQAVLTEINSSRKPKRLKRWVSRFSNQHNRWKKLITKELVRKGMYRLEQRRFLMIPYTRSYIQNPTVRQGLIERLRQPLFYGGTLHHEDVYLLSLIGATNQHHIMCYDRRERRICRKALKTAIETSPIANSVKRYIQDMNAAVMVAVIPS